MTIPASGQFSFSDFNLELGRPPTNELSSTDTALLTLAGISIPQGGVTTSTFTAVTLSTTGLTQVTTAGLIGSADDGYWAVALPFNITYQGTSYSSVYIGTNSYITFGSGANNYSGLGPAVPSYPKIMIGSADNSGTSIWKGQSGSTPNRTYTVQFYGGNSSGGGSIISWQVVFSEANPGQVTLSVIPANNFRAGSVSGFYTSNTLVRSWDPSINTGLIYEPTLAGTFPSFSMTAMRGKSGRFGGVNQQIVYTRYLGETGQVTLYPFPISVGQSTSPQTWSISPALSAGTSLNSANGGVTISQQTALLSSATYAITVTDSSSPVALTTSSGPNALVLTVLYRDLQVYSPDAQVINGNYYLWVRANATGLTNSETWWSATYYTSRTVIAPYQDGIGSLTYGVVGDPALPTGLSTSINAVGLAITGNPGDIPAQTLSYTLTVTDGYPRMTSKTFYLNIVIVNVFLDTALSDFYHDVYLGSSYSSYPIIAAGGSGSTTFSYTGTLPPGMSYSSTGLLSGTPTDPAGTAQTFISVTANNAATSSQFTGGFNIQSFGKVNFNKGWLVGSTGYILRLYDMNTETSTSQSGAAYLWPSVINTSNGQFSASAGANSTFSGYVFGGRDYTTGPLTEYAFRRAHKLLFATQTQSYLGAILNREHSYFDTVGRLNTKAYIGGGYVENRGDNVGYPTPGGYSTTIEAFTYSSETAALIGASLTQARFQPRGVSSDTRGYWAGGWNGSIGSGVIDGITFSDESQRSVAATLNRDGFGRTPLNSSTKGYWAWGLQGSVYFNDIENFNFSNESRSIVATALSESIHYRNSMSRDTKGYLFGALNTYSLNFGTEAIATATAGNNGLFSNQVSLYQSDVA